MFRRDPKPMPDTLKFLQDVIFFGPRDGIELIARIRDREGNRCKKDFLKILVSHVVGLIYVLIFFMCPWVHCHSEPVYHELNFRNIRNLGKINNASRTNGRALTHYTKGQSRRKT
jgi:hypothetical protein